MAGEQWWRIQAAVDVEGGSCPKASPPGVVRRDAALQQQGPLDTRACDNIRMRCSFWIRSSMRGFLWAFTQDRQRAQRRGPGHPLGGQAPLQGHHGQQKADSCGHSQRPVSPLCSPGARPATSRDQSQEHGQLLAASTGHGGSTLWTACGWDRSWCRRPGSRPSPRAAASSGTLARCWRTWTLTPGEVEACEALCSLERPPGCGRVQWAVHRWPRLSVHQRSGPCGQPPCVQADRGRTCTACTTQDGHLCAVEAPRILPRRVRRGRPRRRRRRHLVAHRGVLRPPRRRRRWNERCARQDGAAQGARAVRAALGEGLQLLEVSVCS